MGKGKTRVELSPLFRQCEARLLNNSRMLKPDDDNDNREISLNGARFLAFRPIIPSRRAFAVTLG